MLETCEQGKISAGCVNMARANRGRLDQDKLNRDRQGYWPQLQDKEALVSLHDQLQRHHSKICLYHIQSTWCHRSGLSPACKCLCPVLQALPRSHNKKASSPIPAFTQSLEQPSDVRKMYHNPIFAHAIAWLLSRYAENTKTNLRIHITTPSAYMLQFKTQSTGAQA